MTPRMLAEESVAFLTRVLSESHGQLEGELRAAFIYRHARNILDLAGDVLELESQNRLTGARVLVRPMMESLFRVAAAVKNPMYAAEKIVAEVEDEIEKIRTWTRVEDCKVFQLHMEPTIIQLTAFGQELRKTHNVVTRNRWNVYDTAKEAGLPWTYARDYFLFSKHIHSTISGIIYQEHAGGRFHILQASIAIILLAIGNAAQYLPTNSPQATIDECTRLVELTTSLSNQGAFKDPV